MEIPKEIEVFLNTVSSRVGPVNAMNLLKDARSNAFVEMFKKLGLSENEINEITNRHLQQISQNIVKTVPVVSPIQNHPQK